MEGPICIACESGDHEHPELTEGIQRCECACHRHTPPKDGYVKGYRQGYLQAKVESGRCITIDIETVRDEELTLP